MRPTAQTDKDQGPAGRVVVVGSLNCDLVMQGDRRPGKGETVLGRDFHVFLGGKGHNQAIACARAGAKVAMIGRVGIDPFGDQLIASLAAAAVEHEHVRRDAKAGTGVADIFVDAQGDNSICVAPRANGRLAAQDVEAAAHLFEGARAVLLQLETPMEVAIAAAKRGKAAGACVILNPAPAPVSGGLPGELLANVDLLVPNRAEIANLTGRVVTDLAEAAEAALTLHEQGVKATIITMGELGAVLVDGRHDPVLTPAFDVEVVDTTGAGDAFCGAFAAALATGKLPNEAIVFGCAAGALACSKLGAALSLPHRAELEALVADRKHR